MVTVPDITSMLAMRIIAEMGANYYQCYSTAEAFSKAIGVVPANEVSGVSCSSASPPMAMPGSSFICFLQRRRLPFLIMGR